MNPFSGIMQAVTGSVSGFGDNTANIGKNVHRLPGNDDAMSLSEDHARSFLAWVQNFMDNAVSVDAGDESVFNFKSSDLDSELPAIEQLQAMLAEAMNQSSTGGDVSQAINAQSVEDGHVPIPQGIINAIVAHHESNPFSGIPAHGTLTDVPEMMVTLGNAPALEQTQTAAAGVPAQAGLSDESQIKENTSALGQTQVAVKDPLIQTAVSGVPTQAGQVAGSPNKDDQLHWVMKENMPEEELEKQTTRSLSKPVAGRSEDGQTHTNRMIQERLPSGMGIAERANGSTTHPAQSIAGHSKDPGSIVAGLADQKAPSSEDDTANFRDQAKPNPTQRLAMADVNEDESQKGQSSDSVKSTVPELTKSPPSFQDTAKALAGDQSTNMAVKPTAGQAAALTRTEDSAAKTFQNTVMDQIVDKAAMRSILGRSEIQIRLKPEFLGNVQMNIAADKEQLIVRVLTDRPMVKEIIETHLHQLRTELQNHGLTIDKFEVMVNPDANQQHSRDQFAQMFKHHSSQNGGRQPNEQEPETLRRDDGKNPDDEQPNRDGVNFFA